MSISAALKEFWHHRYQIQTPSGQVWGQLVKTAQGWQHYGLSPFLRLNTRPGDQLTLILAPQTEVVTLFLNGSDPFALFESNHG